MDTIAREVCVADRVRWRGHSEHKQGKHDTHLPDTMAQSVQFVSFFPIRMCKKSGTPERTRTSNRQSRNLVLYPIELPVQVLRQTYNKSMICA